MTPDKSKYKDLLNRLGKRPRIVLEKILENGSVSTYELGQLGYDQPPRAAQDLKEAGVRLKVTFGKHPSTGSRMAIYALAPEQPKETSNFQGRIAFPKKFRLDLFHHHQNRCNLCSAEYPPELLQIDHRVPYIIGGESSILETQDFQSLCGSHQRLKSWVCEHCPNEVGKSISICKTCYWAFPETDYLHVATVKEKRLDIVWIGDKELTEFEMLKTFSRNKSKALSTSVKEIIRNYFNK